MSGEGGQAGGTPAHPRPPLTSCIPAAAGGGKWQLGHGAEPSGWAWGAEVKASSCLLPRTEECHFLSQLDPEDHPTPPPTPPHYPSPHPPTLCRKSPGLGSEPGAVFS